MRSFVDDDTELARKRWDEDWKVWSGMECVKSLAQKFAAGFCFRLQMRGKAFFFSHKLQRLARGIKNNKKYLLIFILLGWSVIGQNL